MDKCDRYLPVHISLASTKYNTGQFKGMVANTKIHMLHGVITDNPFTIDSLHNLQLFTHIH